jgi:hypothetical protein
VRVCAFLAKGSGLCFAPSRSCSRVLSALAVGMQALRELPNEQILRTICYFSEMY